LQSHDMSDSYRLGKGKHLFGVSRVGCEGPLAVEVLTAGDDGLDQLLVLGCRCPPDTAPRILDQMLSSFARETPQPET
jgi:hypothetical protein